MHNFDNCPSQLPPDGFLPTYDDYWQAIREYAAGGPTRYPDWSQKHWEDQGTYLMNEASWVEFIAVKLGILYERVYQDITEELHKQGRTRKLPEFPVWPEDAGSPVEAN